MYFKAPILIKFIWLSAFLFILIGCSSSYVEPPSNTAAYQQNYISRYLVPGQLPVPQSIKSVQLYRKGNEQNPPVIELASSQKLVLSFDELASISGQFRITFTHHDQEWNNSNIPQDWYLDGMNEMIMGNGQRNKLSEPVYHRYKMEFPNDQVQFLISGNYMLHVRDFSSGVELFSIPFFVTEQSGALESMVETIYNEGPRYEAVDQPFSTFFYPDFIDFPQIDLSFYFVQNRFWGDAKQADIKDFAEQDHSGFHLSRDRAFLANFDFIGLDVEDFSVNDRQIRDWRPDLNPPLLVLREDILNFTSSPSQSWGSNYGNPRTSESAQYANVNFRFDDGGQFSENEGVYLVGDFNQWLLSENHRLEYNDDSGYWETTALIKEGTYTYKYATKDDANQIDDVLLSDSITRRQQEYTSFVYFQDPDYRYQRLLHVQFFKN